MAAANDEPTISVNEHVRGVIAAERRTYRNLARVFGQQSRDAEYKASELFRMFATMGEEDDDRIEREIRARS